uniref:2',3'-cyclic nucleotide 3' phosphodiesterase n=1 Tax=Neogobius melanostomus TaxID=47308 RepID=A0A8C6SBC2_9GOBI
MDAEQSVEIIEGADPPQQETVIEKEVVSNMESPADVAAPATTNGDAEQVNGHSEVENGVGTEQAATQEDPNPEADVPKEPASSPSEKDDSVAKEADKPEETPATENVPEPAAVPVETPLKKEEKVVENVEVPSANDAAGEPEKKEEGKVVEEALAAGGEKGEDEKPTDEVKEKPDATETEVIATTAAGDSKTEVKEEEDDPTPQAKLEAMKKPHEEMSIPLYFGWFLFRPVQEKVSEMSMNFFKTLTTLETFKKHLSDFSDKEGEEVVLEQSFKAKGMLHCTAKFTNYGKAEGAKEYAEKKVVQELYGSVSDLSLSALFITPRTVGARVSLTEAQLQLWPEDAEKEADRAHVTLGHAEGIPAVQTGYDLLEILLLQKAGQPGETVELDSGTLTYYDGGRWYLALKEPVSAAACFSSYYKANASGPAKKEKKKPKCSIL